MIGGILAAREESLFQKLLQHRELMGGIVGPAEAWLMIRGLRTLETRVAAHQETALKVAEYLENCGKVRRVYYPGLKSHPQRALVEKQQTGSTGLLSFEIDGTPEQAVKLAEHLQIFKIGVSWGGFESLAFMPYLRLSQENAGVLGGSRNIIRLHCGLEGAQVLISDLEAAFACL